VDRPGARRPISRETRLLLLTILVSVSTLWVLARLRFPERPASNPVGPIINQLAGSTSFEDLATTLTELESRLSQALVVVTPLRAASSSGMRAPGALAALRLDPTVAVAVTAAADVPAAQADATITLLARDPVSGLTVFRVPSREVPAVAHWVPRRPQDPRYLAAVEVTREGPSLRPVFIGNMVAAENPAFPGPLWLLPARTDLDAGTFLFTLEGELAGLAIDHDGEMAIVPGESLRAAADRLQRQDVSRMPGWIGLSVQPLTPPLAAASGAGVGVIVTRVDPEGPSVDRVVVTDVIEAIDNAPVPTPEHWAVQMDRLSAGQPVTLRLRRASSLQASSPQEVTITAKPLPPPVDRPLGLRMRTVARVGAEVLTVAPASAAERAGLLSGDVVTRAGDRDAPTAAEVLDAFKESGDRPLLVAVTRGATHHVLALEPR
jgi:hypothetical protein